jgi:hypothetical protein
MNRRTITACALALGFLAVSGKVALAQEHDKGSNGENHGHLGAGWREQDRLNPEMEGRLRAGSRLDSEMRGHVHPLPSDLSRQYGPAPHGYRYAIIGGNIIMLDDNYLVQDVFRIDVQIR